MAERRKRTTGRKGRSAGPRRKRRSDLATAAPLRTGARDAKPQPPQGGPAARVADLAPMGDLSHVPGDMRRIAILVVSVFALLAVATIVLR